MDSKDTFGCNAFTIIKFIITPIVFLAFMLISLIQEVSAHLKHWQNVLGVACLPARNSKQLGQKLYTLGKSTSVICLVEALTYM